MELRYYVGGVALIVLTCASVLAILALAPSKMSPAKSEQLIIETTWNNVSVPEEENVHVKMTLEKDHLLVDVEAKFYNDPELPDWISKPGTHTTLYDFEVVELFLLGPDEHYLEIELGPRGQYYVLELHGPRNVTKSPIELYKYEVVNDGNGRWSARAHISRSHLPEGIEKLNAYAIHGSGEKRVYMALHPAPFNSSQYPTPDFHQLNLFKETDFFKMD